MSAVLDELTDVVVVEHLDFEPPCENVGRIVPPLGEHPAHFSLQCRVCGSIVLLCGVHVDWIRARLAHPRFTVACSTCHATSRDLAELFEVTPL